MFPLVVAYARTVHKVQGDTIHDPVVIDFTNMSRLGQAYVALSRVVNINQLHILPSGITLTADMFQPHVPDDGENIDEGLLADLLQDFEDMGEPVVHDHDLDE
ncbi:hypothetical protein Vafri_7004 [Volvox africanus]|uniref:ATP-dependent DNA helicase n=1 Tax=Volvox africanus TaxID=51714 RepID=A0A8J4AZW8_9CHLO|nr:hypothetical protein Vafri_7004 [Volvox africanus]